MPVAIVVFGTLLWFDSPSPSRSGSPTPSTAARDRWSLGIRSYRLHSESTVVLRLASDGSSTTVRQDLEGTLHVRVFDRDADAVRVGFQLDPVAIRYDGTPSPDAAAHLGNLVLAVLDPDGRIQELHFAGASPAEYLQMLGEIIRSFQIVIPPTAGDVWSTTETHATGSYRAEYRRIRDDRIEKRKQGYLDAGTEAALLPGARVEVIASTAEFRFDPDTGVLAGATTSENLEILRGAAVLMSSTLRASLSRHDADTQAMRLRQATSFDGLLATIAETPTRQSASALTAQAPPTPPTEEDWRALDSALERLRAGGKEAIATAHDLRRLLVKQPALCAAIPALLADPEMEGEAGAILVHALELAQHEQAQAALVEILAEPEQAEVHRLRAAIAMGGLRQPTPGTLQSLWTARAARDLPGEILLADTAFLAVGAIGNNLREEAADAYDGVRTRLVSTLRAAATPSTRVIALEALGNTRDPTLADDLTPFLDAPEPAVRTAAAHGLRHMDSPRARQSLTERLARETLPRVRRSIVESLRQQPSCDAESLALVTRLVVGEADEGARYAMVQLLGSHLEDHPPARPTLEGLLPTESSNRIRPLLVRILGAR